jgi:hypothetical protein
MVRLLIVALCLACFPATGYGALDPAAQTPYQLQVVLQLADHPLLTKVFENRLRREIRDGVQAGLGDLGRVEVLLPRDLETRRASGPEFSVEQTRSLWQQVQSRGLQQGLDGGKGISEVKSHFILVDFVEGAYEIQSRQWDGMTGLASPLVRKVVVADRELVARTAAQQIELDFGVVGTVQEGSLGPDLYVALQAGELGDGPRLWVHKGDVFAVSRVRQDTTSRWGERVDWTLLWAIAEPEHGRCRCRLLNRYDAPLGPGPSVQGYRCLKLGVVEGPVQLRIVDDKTLNPLASLRVVVSAHQFGSKGDEEGSTNAEGFIRTLKPYPGIALVQVFNGTTFRARAPVEIVGERITTLPIGIDAGDERRGQFSRARNSCLGRLNERLLASGELFKELLQLNTNKSREAALQVAQNGVKDLQSVVAAFQAELAGLRSQAREAGDDPAKKLADCDEALEQLRANETQLQHYVSDLVGVLKQENDPRRIRIKEMLAKARLHEGEAEFDLAIELYEKVLQEAGNQPALNEYADKLRQLKSNWELKGEDHRRVRDFFYKVWPGLDSAAKLKARMVEAKNGLEVLRAKGDRLTPLMLLKVNIAHANRLSKRLEALGSAGEGEDREESQTILEVKDELKKLTRDASEFIRHPNAPPA